MNSSLPSPSSPVSIKDRCFTHFWGIPKISLDKQNHADCWGNHQRHGVSCTPKASYTKTWNPRTSVTMAKWSSKTLGCLGSLVRSRKTGRKTNWSCHMTDNACVWETNPRKNKPPFSSTVYVYVFGMVWYELQARDLLFRTQAAESLIWQNGIREYTKQSWHNQPGKDVSWAFNLEKRPGFPLLMEMLEKLPKLNQSLSHPGHTWKLAKW